MTAAVCLSVNKITQKVTNGLEWHFQEMLIMVQEKVIKILVMIWRGLIKNQPTVFITAAII